jgi:hypothetical protein
MSSLRGSRLGAVCARALQPTKILTASSYMQHTLLLHRDRRPQLSPVNGIDSSDRRTRAMVEQWLHHEPFIVAVRPLELHEHLPAKSNLDRR